jgi:hypothetical protein
MRPHAQRQEDSTVRNFLLEGGLLGLFLVGSGLVGKGCSMARVIPSYDSGRSYLVRGSSRRVDALTKLKLNLRPELPLRLI